MGVGRAYRQRGKNAMEPRHIRVVEEYFAHNCNQLEAMRAAGYAESYCKSKASAVFKRKDVQDEIARRMAKRAKKYELDEDWVIQRLMRIANADLGAILVKLEDNDNDLSVLNEEESYVLAEVITDFDAIKTEDEDGKTEVELVRKLKLKITDKKGALDSLCRRLGLFQDKVSLTADASLVELLQEGRKRTSGEKK